MEGKLKGSGREGKGDSLSHNYNYIIVNLKLRNAKLITNKMKINKNIRRPVPVASRGH